MRKLAKVTKFGNPYLNILKIPTKVPHYGKRLINTFLLLQWENPRCQTKTPVLNCYRQRPAKASCVERMVPHHAHGSLGRYPVICLYGWCPGLDGDPFRQRRFMVLRLA